MRLEPPSRFTERFELAFSRITALVPGFGWRLLAGAPVEIDGQRLHPEAQAFRRLLRWSGDDRVAADIEGERQGVARGTRRARGAPIPVGAIEGVVVRGAAGELSSRLYVPEQAPEHGPLLVYFHGGGFAVGTLDSHDQTCRLICREAGTRVLSVAYRLGPEHPFPAAHDDALAAYRDVAAGPARFGAAEGAVAVGGDSAGGNLATWVARSVRDDGGPAPAFQALIYPVCDRTRTRRSHELFGEGFVLTRERIALWHDAYHTREQASDLRLSPLLAADLAGLPPAHILIAGFDPLRDECREYAERLREAGNEITVGSAADLFHTFINAVGVSRRCREALTEFARGLPGPR